MTKIVFFQVKDTSSKLSKICQTALFHFEKKESLLILTPNQTVVEFVDALLWRFPEDSFLPHSISDAPCADLIAITATLANVNQACRVFNLNTDPVFWKEPIKIIYELEDLTSPEKKQLSQNRYAAYRKAGYQISSL
jgi:DNA polymerase III subunit chi